MVRAQLQKAIHRSMFFSLLLSLGGHLFAQQDPPSRVARLNYINGNVSMEPAGVDDWAPADLNRPFSIGDYLFADTGAEAELHLDEAVLRMGPQTSFGFLNLDDRTVQLKLTEGDMYIRIHNFGSDQVFEVDTPNAAVNLLRDGVYRFRIDPNGSMSFVVVREGQAEITGGGQAFTLNPGNSATLNGTDQLSYDIEVAPSLDEFDQWSEQRDAQEARFASDRYLPPTVIGAEDLGEYGSWQNNTDYGPVWYPQNVDSGWAPYQNGHWAWIDPWGWTWVDSMPWGFAPFHYGRWAYIGNRWGWCPGPVAVGYRGPAVRPYYAPAMVAWFGGAHWGIGITAGGGPSLGWVPLGWGEVYTPTYHCSPSYFNNVNVYNTRIVNRVNITNVYNTVYVNKQVYNRTFVNERAPNAVMSMPQSAFVSGRAARQAGAPVRPGDLSRFQNAAVLAPPAAPTRQSFLASASSRPAPRPAPQVVQRQVIARNVPPAAPAPIASRQQFLQQHAGQVINYQAMQQAAGQHSTQAAVRQAPAARPVTVRPGARVGNVTAFNRPAAAPSPAAERTSPGVPASARPQQMPAAARPVENPAGVSGPVQSRTTVSTPIAGSPSPGGHGVPPNLRQGGGAPQTPASRDSAERTSRGNGQIAPNRPETPQGMEGRNQQQRQPAQETQSRAQGEATAPAQRGTPANRQRYQNEEDRQQTPARTSSPAAVRPESRVEERTPTAPVRSGAPAREPQVEERTAPARPNAQPENRRETAAPQNRPAAPRENTQGHDDHRSSQPSHEEHPKDDKSTKSQQ